MRQPFKIGIRRQTAAVATRAILLVVATVLLALTQSAIAATNITTYNVTGVFKGSRSDGHKAVIAHETIPGYMEAMTMPFNVKNPSELGGLQPGDKIKFRLSVTETDDWIDQIRLIGRGKTGDSTAAVIRANTRELAPGALLPDCVLTNQSGQILRLRDFHGRALAFTFFFTRCPLPTYCPRMNTNFEEAQAALQADTMHTNWQLLSISFDPDFDTPARLADYARGFHRDPAHWTFATGSTNDVQLLGRGFGLMLYRDGTSISHNLRTVVVDASGRVQKIFTDNEWQPAEVVAELKRAMQAAP